MLGFLEYFPSSYGIGQDHVQGQQEMGPIGGDSRAELLQDTCALEIQLKTDGKHSISLFPRDGGRRPFIHLAYWKGMK